MVLNNNLGKKNNVKKKLSKQTNINRQSFIVFGVVVILIAVIFTWLINSSFWPWPSQNEIARRFNEVIDSCIYNELNRNCSILQEKYEVTFKYCHSLTNIPEIGKPIPLYGVAVDNNFLPSQLSYENTASYFPFYYCGTSIDTLGDIEITNLPILPRVYVLDALSVVPKRTVIGNLQSCKISGVGFNEIWSQIPNSEVIENEYQAASDTYNKCSQIITLQTELNKINEKTTNYSNNEAIQQYYRYYDQWNTITDNDNVGCKVGDNGIFYTNTRACLEGRTLGDFSQVMKESYSNNNFASKLVKK